MGAYVLIVRTLLFFHCFADFIDAGVLDWYSLAFAVVIVVEAVVVLVAVVVVPEIATLRACWDASLASRCTFMRARLVFGPQDGIARNAC